MTEEEQKEVLQIVKEIQLLVNTNKNFDKLSLSLEDIKEKLNEISKALYDPDRGIYKRINDTNAADDDQEEHLDRLEDDQESFLDILNKHNNRLLEIEQAQEDLKKIAGGRMEHLDSAIKMNKNTKKLLWVGLSALVAIAIKEFWPSILAIFM